LADKRTKTKTAAQPRALEAEVHQFPVLGEMTGLLQRVRANKSKRSANSLLKSGRIQVHVVALDDGGEWSGSSAGGPFTIQCLLGAARVSMQGRDHRLTTGDLLVVDAGIDHDITADEASVLLLTVAVSED